MSPGLCPAAGCGPGVPCLPALAGRRLRPACSCRSARSLWLPSSRGQSRRSAGVFGSGPASSAPLSGRRAVCRSRVLRSRWRCLPACRPVRPAHPCRRCLVCLRWGLWVFSLPGVVAVAGSRHLPAVGSTLVVRVASVLAASGSSFVVGCCSGADAALLSAVPGSVPPSLVRCLCAFGPGGVGSGSFSAVDRVVKFAGSGGVVQWWAGGPASVPLHARLADRTRAVAGSASVGLVVFFASPSSRGSLLACRCAVSRGLPVLAFPVGFPAAQLPVFGAGFWAPAGQFGGYFWAKNQHEIFS